MQVARFAILPLLLAGCLGDGLRSGAAVTGSLPDLALDDPAGGPVSCNAFCVDTWSERAVAPSQPVLDPLSSVTVEAWVYPLNDNENRDSGVVVAHRTPPRAEAIGGYLLR